MAIITNLSFTILKSGCVGRRLEEDVKKMIEAAGFTISKTITHKFTTEQSAIWYEHLASSKFFNETCTNMSAARLRILELERDDDISAQEAFRAILGETDPQKAAKIPISGEWCDKLGLPRGTQTIRGAMFIKYGQDVVNISFNVAHGPDSEENKAREMDLLKKWIPAFSKILKKIGVDALP